jgi:hypothetical protein
MISRKITDLIHRDFEGELSESEKLELGEILKNDPEAMQYRKDWTQIESGLAENRMITEKVSLAKEILNRIPMEAQMTHRAEPLIRPKFWNRPAFRYVTFFIAGILIGFFSFSVFMPGGKSGSVSADQIKGSFYDSRTFDQMKVADNLAFENPMVKSSFDVRYSSSVVEIRVSLSSLYPVQGLIMFDYNSLQPMNVVNVSVNDQSTIMASSNYVQINNSGNNQYIIQLLNKNSLPQQISIKIIQNDMPIYQNAVTVNRD